MPYKLKLDLENLPPGGTVTVDGIGELTNGEEHEITDEQNEAFMAAHATNEDFQAEVDGEVVTLHRRKLGEPIDRAFDGVKGFEVTPITETTSEPDKNQVSPAPVVPSAGEEPVDGSGEGEA